MRKEEANRENKKSGIGGATFLVSIQCRQNMSWQGLIQWLETEKTCTFRSELELMMLINEAAEMANVKGSEGENISWEKKEKVHKRTFQNSSIKAK